MPPPLSLPVYLEWLGKKEGGIYFRLHPKARKAGIGCLLGCVCLIMHECEMSNAT